RSGSFLRGPVMPSPFPGMDPYLEGDLWTTVHTQLGAEIARQLTPWLRPRYVALAEKRFVMDAPEDVAVSGGDPSPDLGVGVPHVWVEIRDTAHRKLVTAIEFLSRTNKRGAGREEYLEKREKLLLSTAHLMEIDLLRRGRRVPMQEPLPAGAYFVLL